MSLVNPVLALARIAVEDQHSHEQIREQFAGIVANLEPWGRQEAFSLALDVSTPAPVSILVLHALTLETDPVASAALWLTGGLEFAKRQDGAFMQAALLCANFASCLVRSESRDY